MSTEDFPKPKDVAYKLRRIRENFRLTHQELARDLNDYRPKSANVDADLIREVEDGKREVPLLLLLCYSWYSNIPIESLINDEVHLFDET